MGETLPQHAKHKKKSVAVCDSQRQLCSPIMEAPETPQSSFEAALTVPSPFLKDFVRNSNEVGHRSMDADSKPSHKESSQLVTAAS